MHSVHVLLVYIADIRMLSIAVDSSATQTCSKIECEDTHTTYQCLLNTLQCIWSG